MVGLTWLLIGYLASQRKGWKSVAGLLEGALLGLLSLLLFFASGVGVADRAKAHAGGPYGSAATPEKGIRLSFILLVAVAAVIAILILGVLLTR